VLKDYSFYPNVKTCFRLRIIYQKQTNICQRVARFRVVTVNKYGGHWIRCPGNYCACFELLLPYYFLNINRQKVMVSKQCPDHVFVNFCWFSALTNAEGNK